MLPTQVTQNFSAAEIEKVSDPIPPALEANTLRATQALQRVRSAFGVPFYLTSHYRSAAHNTSVGGSETSDHMNALAFDFVVRGMSLKDFYARFTQLEAQGKIGDYDQMIVYPYTTGHVHIGFGSRNRRQKLIRVSDEIAQQSSSGKVYQLLTSIAQFPKTGAGTITGLVIVLILAAVLILPRLAR